MRVKIGSQWYDSSDVPICVQLTQKELKNIKSAPKRPQTFDHSGDPKYAVFPEGSYDSEEERIEWMTK